MIGDVAQYGSFQFDSLCDETDDSFQVMREDTQSGTLSWIMWKTGIAFAHRSRTLLILKQETNESCPDHEFLSRRELSVKFLEEAYRIEVHVYTDECIQLVNKLATKDDNFDVQLTPMNIAAYATRLLVMVSGHIKSLATNWFPGMLVSTPRMSFVTFVPCWKCYAEISGDSHNDQKHLASKKTLPGYFICKEMNPVHCFILEDNIVPAALGEDLKCPIHSAVKCVQMVPDLVSALILSMGQGGLFHPHPLMTVTSPLIPSKFMKPYVQQQ